MDQHALHQIRFNKRATLEYKETWQGRWTKEEVKFAWDLNAYDSDTQTLCIADHWYFQTGLWRVQPIHATIRWLTADENRRRLLEQRLAEEAVNHAMDGRLGAIPGLTLPAEDPRVPEVRRRVQRTFIWGPIGENRFVRHIGGDEPTAAYDRDGGIDDPKRAWREIEEERRRYGA